MMDALRHHMQHVRSRRGRDQENRRDVEPPDMQRHGFSPLQASAQPSVRVEDRKSVVSGKSVSVRVDLGSRRAIKKTKRTWNAESVPGAVHKRLAHQGSK